MPRRGGGAGEFTSEGKDVKCADGVTAIGRVKEGSKSYKFACEDFGGGCGLISKVLVCLPGRVGGG